MDEINRILEYVKVNPSEALESDTLEFKNYSSENSFFGAKDVAEEISALANTKGGYIIIGIIDSSNISNRRWDQQLNGFLQIDLSTAKERLLGKIEPKLNLILFNHSYDGKNYLVIKVPKVNYSIVSTSSGKICIRVGKSSMPARPEQINALVKGLQNYDWSDEEISDEWRSCLSELSMKEAKSDFIERRNINEGEISDEAFLESIGATKNGLLNKGGLLFLGKPDCIRNLLGVYEYRFSWKTNSGELRINDVWSDNVWETIKRAKSHFVICNSRLAIEYEGLQYELSTLDEQAFHEAYLNAIVHRDYSEEGMTSINFTGKKLIITNPGEFYGGVNSSNITFHEPRHRNKTLAKILMNFQLVDRAGMGVLRMGLNSLKYGREFPRFEEKLKAIEVSMEAEYFKSGIFILTQKYLKNCGITELYILNSMYAIGYVNVVTLEAKLASILEHPWESIQEAMGNEDFRTYVCYKASNEGVYICPSGLANSLFDVSKPFQDSKNSEKHVKLLQFLKLHRSANNEELMNLMGFTSSASTYQFLSKLKYVINRGRGRSSKWFLK
ncbi:MULTISPECIES: RNA-binding domain-containing protein [unclassified Paraflavitalea]|uniref:RNA-binding domain-containing protein n=1 Tax=unclassified Paraflavitalea TaxID=2798305 RepID=UPI003D33A2D8